MNLSAVLRKWRLMTDRSIRQAAREIGISATALVQFEKGDGISGDNLTQILRWLFRPAREAVRRDLAAGEGDNECPQDSMIETPNRPEARS